MLRPAPSRARHIPSSAFGEALGLAPRQSAILELSERKGTGKCGWGWAQGQAGRCKEEASSREAGLRPSADLLTGRDQSGGGATRK